MSKIYKLLHKPTGLFFKKSRSTYGKKKPNLHKDGTVYTVKPNFSWIRDGVKGLEEFIPFVEGDWEIREYIVENE